MNMKVLSSAVLALGVVCGIRTAAYADERTAVVTDAAPVYLLPDTNRTPLRIAAANTVLRVRSEEGSWMKVEFQDPQFGLRTGYVETRLVRVRVPVQEPMDLSFRDETLVQSAAPQQQPGTQDPRIGREQFSTQARKFKRGFVDVDLGIASAGTKEYSTTYNTTLFSEAASMRADYRLPTGAAFDVGGGVMITPTFGLAVSFLGTAHQDEATLAIRIPHPIYANAYASDESETQESLMRSEGSTNIQLVFATELSPKVSLRVFGGPSLFRVRQDVVRSITYAQVYGIFSRVNEVAITGYLPNRVEFDEASGWGVNAGADVAYFFTPVVGVGGFAKFNRGSVTTYDLFSAEDVQLKTGGMQTGGGLRLRF